MRPSDRIMRPRGRGACACARRPSGSRTGRRRFAPPGGREWRPRAYWRRRPGRPRAPPSAGRSAWRSPHSSPSCPAEWRGAPARPAAERRCRGCQAAGRGPCRAPRRGRRPRATVLLELRVAADELRPGKAVLQIAQRALRIVAEQDGADALVGGRDQHRAERGLADGEADFVARAPRRIAVGVMPSSAVGLLVEAAGGVEARVIDRLGDVPRRAQVFGRAPCPHGRRHRPWA